MHLFKYAPLERIDILLKEAIRYTQPSDLNDPYEMRLDFDNLTSDDYNLLQRHIESQDIITRIRNTYETLPADIRATLPVTEDHSIDMAVQYLSESARLELRKRMANLQVLVRSKDYNKQTTV